jgi:hypothetical protein
MIYQREVEIKGKYDIIVAGGGFSGFSAAYAAAREGAKVLLIERNSTLGGVGTQALVNHILGVRAIVDGHLTQCVGDVFALIEKRILSEGSGVDVNSIDFTLNPHGWYPGLGTGLIFDSERMKLLLETMLFEAGVKLLYTTDIVDVIRNGDSISSLVVHNKSGLAAYSAEYFVDTTGDADIVRLAGLECDFGDENGGVSAASLEMHVEGVDKAELCEYMKTTGDVRFKSIIKILQERKIWKFPYEIFISVNLVKDDVFMINTIRQVGIDGVDAESVTLGVVEGRRENYKLLEIMREYFPGFKNARVRQIAPSIGIRETYRIRAERTLTVLDLIECQHLEDSVALSGYGWDLPDPKRPTHNPGDNRKRNSIFAEIPYGALVPRGIDNLIVAGRCIGTEREALGPTRVMGPCIATGTAAGIASAMALSDRCAMRDVDVGSLREKLRSHGGIVNREDVIKGKKVL